jgi:4-hydroxybenzoyl-CoA reductase subunit alpha
MRGHGTVNVRFAFESQLDEVAAAIGMDPADLRRRNLLQPPCITVNGLRVLSYGLPECIERVVKASAWRERKGHRETQGSTTAVALASTTASRSPFADINTREPLRETGNGKRGTAAFASPTLKRGLGIACSHYVSGAANSIIRSDMPHSTVNLKVDRDGGVVVYTGAADIGQGSDTMTAQIAAEVLGCSLRRVKVVAADTDLTPIDLGSYSSRVTFMAGNATLRAAEQVRERIAIAAAKKLNCLPGEVVLRNDLVFKRDTVPALELMPASFVPRRENSGPDSGRVEGQILRGSVQQRRKAEDLHGPMSFEEAVVAAIDFHGALTGTGSYAPPSAARGGHFQGAGVGPSPAYSYSAQVAEVSVDEETGEVTVHRIWAAHDCGRALNPIAVEGQVIGSVWMGLGQALQEELVWKDGLIMNPGLLEYRSPSAAESPHIETFIVESSDPEGPFGAKEAGEGSLAATIPAIANAIYDAIGIRLRETPFTPDRVLAALRKRRALANGVDLTERVDPTAPIRFREHGGVLCFDGKGPARHSLDTAQAGRGESGGDD